MQWPPFTSYIIHQVRMVNQKSLGVAGTLHSNMRRNVHEPTQGRKRDIDNTILVSSSPTFQESRSIVVCFLLPAWNLSKRTSLLGVWWLLSSPQCQYSAHMHGYTHTYTHELVLTRWVTNNNLHILMQPESLSILRPYSAEHVIGGSHCVAHCLYVPS